MKGCQPQTNNSHININMLKANQKLSLHIITWKAKGLGLVTTKKYLYEIIGLHLRAQV